MISNDNIVSVRSDIIFECCDCSIEVNIVNNYVEVTATKVSNKGYIIQESIALDRGSAYENITNFLNQQKDIIKSLIEKLNQKAEEHNGKVINIGD